MKANFFMPKYMATFKCIGPKCTDTCCAGWDINIDEATFKKYENNNSNLNDLVKGKYIKNEHSADSFNYGFMVITKDKKCPFLNNDLLCEIHGKCGEENLSITCKRYPRVFNIIDDIYEKSGIPSCEEICSKAFLNKEKMEFIEAEEELDEETIEIRRVIDTDAFIDSDSLIQYFWDIRVNSINIMQNRDYSIEERLLILKSFYEKLEYLKKEDNFYEIEEMLEEINEDPSSTTSILKDVKLTNFDFDINFFNLILSQDLLEKVIGNRLKDFLTSLKRDENLKHENFNYDDFKNVNSIISNYSYIFENYLVNQIFKEIIPFNKGEDLSESIKTLINTYKLIKAYLTLLYKVSKKEITEYEIIHIIQALSKDLEHNKVFKSILEID
ncbi:flagellin lysine-N-methylase [Clostridium perfringens]|nr:flagellin lysine-N-methylase [Clostridium perfringens]